MASGQKVQGLNIKLSADTTAVNEALKDVNKSLSSTTKELKDVERLLKIDPTNITALTQKQKLLTDAIDKTNEKLTQLRKIKELADNDNGVDKNTKEYRELEREIEKATATLKTFQQEQENTANATENVSKAFNDVNVSALEFNDIFNANVLGQLAVQGLNLLANTLNKVGEQFKKYACEYQNLEVYEAQFENNIRNTTKASDDEIKSLKNLAKQKSQQGVISKKSITSAYQELATYVESTKAIEGLTNALVDMSAQQYGVDATEESVRNIATTLGKALANGDYSGLTRLGYGFDEAQQSVMKYGTELERVAVLNDVISSSIGGMNEKLAQTDAGQIYQLSNAFESIKENIGEVVSSLEISAYQNIIDWFNDENTQKIFEYIGQLGTNISDNAQSLEIDLSPALDKVLYAIVLIMEATDKIVENIKFIDGWINDGNLGRIKSFIDGIKQGLDLLLATINLVIAGMQFIAGNKTKIARDTGSVVNSDGFNSKGFGSLQSGGFSSGGLATINANFTINNQGQPIAQDLAYQMVAIINEELGGMV